VQSRPHYEQAIALYDPAKHRSLAARFGQDARVAALSFRSWAMWMLGYPQAGLSDADQAIQEAREIGQSASLMFALTVPLFTHIQCGSYAIANLQSDEVVALGDKKDTLFWNAWGMMNQGCVPVLTGKASDAVARLTSGITAFRATGGTIFVPWYQSYLARACVELGQFDDARRHVDEAMTAMEKTKEKWCEAELNRMAGEIALMAPYPDAAKAEEYFERALSVARAQQAKSWELRAATSVARLWRDQGKVQQARELLAPVYGWFTEGFDTRDLKQAKALLEELAA
jgi:predicted ATPase